MADVVVKLNMAALIAISSEANTKICVPMAQRILSQVGDGYRMETSPRPGEPGWARTVVMTDSFDAMRREVRDGRLARAFGNA